MSIRRKVFFIILVVFAFMGGVNFLIQRFIVFPSFLELEAREAGENLQRIRYAIDREIVHLDRLCLDWAIWDDAYSFIQNTSEEFISSNLTENTLEADHLSLLVFCRLDGTIVWGSSLYNDAKLPFPFLQTKKIRLDHPLLHMQAGPEKTGNSGIIDTQFGPMLFSTQIIRPTGGAGPGNGFLIMGSLMNTEMLATLKEQTRIPFELKYPISPTTQLCGSINQGFHINNEKLSFIELNTGKYIQSCFGYPDITGKPIFGVEYLFPREITRKGIGSMGYAAALAIILGLFILLILNLILRNVILQPIQHLTTHALTIEQGKNFSLRLDMPRQDEIGQLAHSFDTMVATIDQQTKELQLANEQLILLSVQDGLTSIANRRMFDTYLNKEWRRATREQTSLSLILLDVDFFKRYNDTYGHQQGDRCLIAIAETMQKHIHRPADLAARYGGEEFAIILPNTDAEGAQLIAERVRQGVQDLELPHTASDASPYVSISLGVNTIVPQATGTAATLLSFIEQTDQHLYRAKESGRNRLWG